MVMMMFAAPNVVLAEEEGFDVPSGVPTETTPAPIKLSVPDTTLTVNGCTAPNAFVTLFENNQPIGTVVADANARFSKTLIGQNFGLHTIKAFYEDSNGRTSAALSRNISIAPQANTNLPLFLAPTISVSPSRSFVGDTVTFRGTTAPGATVNVTIDNNTTAVAIANSLGNWFVSVDTEDYFIGTHVFRAVAALNGCGPSEQTETGSFSIGRPDADDFIRNDGPSEIVTPIITEPRDGFLAGNPGVLIVGEAPANAQIEIVVDGELVGSVFANARGAWTFPFTMTKLSHEVQSRMCIDGKCSELSEPITFQFRGEQLNENFGRLDGCEINFRLENYRFYGLQPGDGIDINIESLTGTGQYEMLIDWGDTTIERLNLYRDNQTRFHHVFKDTGQFNGTITIEDANNCIFTQYISVDVAEGREFNWWWLLLLTIPPATVIGYRTTRHLYRVKVRYIG